MKLKMIIMLMLVVIATATSCSAKRLGNKGNVTPPIVATDTLMHKAVGDSIYRIIKNVKRIEISSLKLESDSLSQMITQKVPSSELGLLKFIATNPKNFMSNTIVYGNFIPQFQATYTTKKAMVTLKYDFGLRKWGIFNAEDKEIAMFDLSSDNMLRFACKMFPDNQFFHELLLTRE